MSTCQHGFHVYKDIWNPVLHEVLQTKQEFGNVEDQYAVVVIKESDGESLTVGQYLEKHQGYAGIF